MSQVKLSWTAPTDNVEVASYLVEQQDPGSTSFVQTGTSYNDTGLAAGSTYSYGVRAMNAARNPSEYSSGECGDRFAYDRSSQIALNEDGSPVITAVVSEGRERRNRGIFGSNLRGT